MNFKGAVSRRSTSGTPKHSNMTGEAEIFGCNPQRVHRIEDEIGWKSVFIGTLNLRWPMEYLMICVLCLSYSSSAHRMLSIQQTRKTLRCTADISVTDLSQGWGGQDQYALMR